MNSFRPTGPAAAFLKEVAVKYFWLWIICLMLACIFLWLEGKKKHAYAAALKGMASLCFVLLGFLSARMTSNGTLTHNVISGLCLGLIADVLLNLRFVFPDAGRKIFLIGILVFLAGHVMYIIALVPVCSHLPAALIAAAVLTAALVCWIFTKITAAKAFKIFGVFYLGAIMVMTCIAFANLFAAPSVFTGMFAAGALLFLGSDIILILNTFGPKSRENLRIANILLYYMGQLLIASSLQFI